jgi:hypothetical protein
VRNRIAPVNVIMVVKSTQRFIFVFDDESFEQAVNVAVEYAQDPDLDFDWNDAAQTIETMKKVMRT